MPNIPKTPNSFPIPEVPNLFPLPESSVALLDEAKAVWLDRKGLRGDAVKNIAVFGDLSRAVIHELVKQYGELENVPSGKLGSLLLLASKLQRIITEQVHRDHYLDAVNYILLTHASDVKESESDDRP